MSFRTGFHKGKLGIGLSTTMGMNDGTGNPRYPLDINGDIRLTGAIVDANGNPIEMMAQQRSFPEAISTIDTDIGDGTVYGVGDTTTTTTTTSSNDKLSFNYKTNLGTSWTKLGQDIRGVGAGDVFGYRIAFNDDGTIVASTGPEHNGNKGHVRVFQYVNNTWTQLGNEIEGPGSDDYLRTCCLNSDGTILAVGITHYTAADHGLVKVYQYDGTSWTQLGQDLNSNDSWDLMGYGIDLNSDGTILAVGAWFGNSPGADSGWVKIYEYNGTSWVQQGSDIGGEAAADHSGLSVSLNRDGKIVAIGAHNNGGGDGHVRIYNYNGTTWTQLGSDIDGTTSDDNLGIDVAINDDGTIVAIGADSNDDNGTNSGKALVYHYHNNTWIQKGNTLKGNTHDRFGSCIDINGEGDIIVVGALYGKKQTSATGSTHDYGFARVFQYNGVEWLQIGVDIEAEIRHDYVADVKLSRDGTIVGVGFSYNDEAGADAGKLRILQARNNVLEVKNEELGSDAKVDIVGTMKSNDILIGGTLTTEIEPTHVRIEALQTTGTPSGRYGSNMIYINTTYHKGIFLFNGYTGSYVNEIYHYDIKTSVWTLQTYTDSVRAMYNYPIVRNGVMYLFGGHFGSNGNYNNLYFIDFNNENLAWETLTVSGTRPGKRYGYGAALHQNRYMYIWGGRDSSSYNDMHRIDFETNTWEEITQLGDIPGARYAHTMTIWKDRYIIVMGGNRDSGGYATDGLYVFDINTNRWKKEHLRTFHDTTYNIYAEGNQFGWTRWAHIFGDYMVIPFGYAGSGTGFGAVCSINLNNYKLKILKSNNSWRRYHMPSVKVDDNTIYGFGGYNSAAGNSGRLSDTLKFEFNVAKSIINNNGNKRDKMYISDDFKTYSWDDCWRFAKSQGGTLPTRAYILNNYEFLFRGNVDRWVAAFGKQYDVAYEYRDWIHLGSLNHSQGKSHRYDGGGYPSWGDDSTTSYDFKEQIIVVFTDDLKLNNALNIRSDGNITIGHQHNSRYRISLGTTAQSMSKNTDYFAEESAIALYENIHGGGNYFYGLGLCGSSNNEGLGFWGGSGGVLPKSSNVQFFLKRNGFCGIQTSSPANPLEIYQATTSWNGVSTALRYVGTSTTSNNNWNAGWDTSIKCLGAVWITGNAGLMVTSDRRIKENIVDVSDNQALEMLRNIPCRYYEYKDKVSRGPDKTIGFIAQEVKEIMPMAVVIKKDIIPNEMRDLTDISWNNTTLYTDISDCSGVKYRFYVTNDMDGTEGETLEIVGNSDDSFTFDTSYNHVFCYGKEIDDLHTIDKQKLFALNFSATQELDKKVKQLEQEKAELKTEVDTLKSELAAIKQHLGI